MPVAQERVDCEVRIIASEVQLNDVTLTCSCMESLSYFVDHPTPFLGIPRHPPVVMGSFVIAEKFCTFAQFVVTQLHLKTDERFVESVRIIRQHRFGECLVEIIVSSLDRLRVVVDRRAVAVRRINHFFSPEKVVYFCSMGLVLCVANR